MDKGAASQNYPALLLSYAHPLSRPLPSACQPDPLARDTLRTGSMVRVETCLPGTPVRAGSFAGALHHSWTNPFYGPARFPGFHGFCGRVGTIREHCPEILALGAGSHRPVRLHTVPRAAASHAGGGHPAPAGWDVRLDVALPVRAGGRGTGH